MTPETSERFAVLVERQLAGLLSPTETADLSKILESSEEARELYLRALEFHVDLGAAFAGKAPAMIPTAATPRTEPVAPSGEGVGVPRGRFSRNPRPLPEATPTEDRLRRWTTRFASFSVAAGFLVIATFMAFWLGTRGDEDPDRDTPGISKGGGRDGLKGLGDTKSRKGIQETPGSSFELPPPPHHASRIAELRHDVLVNVWQINMTALLSEVMRYRNLTNEWALFQADIAKYDSKIKDDLGELAKVGEKLPLETYLAQGDQILGFAQRDFTTMKPGEAAQVIHTWLLNWRGGPALEQVNVARGDKKLTLYLEFPEETQELLTLLRHPSLGDLGNSGSRTVKEMVGIPPELLSNIASGFNALPPGYRSYLIPAERRRLEDLALNKRGSSDDIDWLRTRVLGEAIPSFQREADSIHSKVLELEPRLKDNVAADVIIRKNGTKLECQIVQETPEFVKVKSRFAAVTIPREEIERVEKGKGAATEFPGKYAEAKGQLDKLVPLLAWCTEKGLKFEREYVAYNILMLDASNEKARTTVNLGRPAITSGISVAPPKGGMIAYERKDWNAVELKEKLLKDGYSLLGGKWYSRRDKLIVVPGLFRYERQSDKPVLLGGSAPLCNESEDLYKMAQDPVGGLREEIEVRQLRRFYAPQMVIAKSPKPPAGVAPPQSTPELSIQVETDEGRPAAGTPMKGEVTIRVPVGAPILEASVLTTAEVKAGGSISVYHVTGSGENEKRTKLYACDAKESQMHAIPTDLVRGLSEVTLVAVIEQTAAYIPKTERRHARAALYKGKDLLSPALDVVHYRQIPDYQATLFPSNANTIEVFRLRVVVADEAPTLDKLFAGHPEILK